MNVHTAFALSLDQFIALSDADMIIVVGGDESDEYHSAIQNIGRDLKPHLKILI